MVDQLRRAAGAGLEDARVQAEVEALAPGVDVERRIAGREDLHHALGRKEAVRQSPPKRRGAAQFAPPGPVHTQIHARDDQALHHALAQRRPVAGERDRGFAWPALERAVHRRVAGARQEADLAQAGRRVGVDRIFGIGEGEVVLREERYRALPLERVVQPPVHALRAAAAQLGQHPLADIHAVQREKQVGAMRLHRGEQACFHHFGGLAPQELAPQLFHQRR